LVDAVDMDVDADPGLAAGDCPARGGAFRPHTLEREQDIVTAGEIALVLLDDAVRDLADLPRLGLMEGARRRSPRRFAPRGAGSIWSGVRASPNSRRAQTIRDLVKGADRA